MYERSFTRGFSSKLVTLLLTLSVFLGVSSQPYSPYRFRDETETLIPHGVLNLKQIQVTLSPEIVPQYVFTLHETNTEFGFEISKEIIRPGDSSIRHDFRINIVIEKMTCYNSEDRYPALLVIQGHNETLMVCKEIDNEKNAFQTVLDLMDNKTSIKVRTEGDWSGFSAKLVASIYYEVQDGCGDCDNGHFCCGYQGSPSGRRSSNLLFIENPIYRCIPMYGRPNDRNNELICNQHPNCGFFSNADESRTNCGNYSESCVGSDCNLADVALRIAVLIVFCFLLPPIIILFLCRFNTVRSGCERFNTRIARRFRRRGDSQATIDEATESSTITAAAANRRHRNPSQNYNAGDDPPPSYEEYLRHFKQPDPPSFYENVEQPPPEIDVNGNPSHINPSGLDSLELPHHPIQIQQQCSNCSRCEIFAIPINNVLLEPGTLIGVDNLAFVTEGNTRNESES